MGLHMDNIHTPTVPSGPSSAQAHAQTSTDTTPLLDLIAEKDRVESELRALMSVLESHGANMNTTLTTFDGFPRSDLDVAQIRTTRARIIHLRNDYKALMSRIEKGLHAHHASIQASSSPATSSKDANTSREAQDSGGLIETPFAKVNSVVDGSPADEAGLKAGDKIRNFGTVNWMNHEKLAKVAEVVQRSEGRSMLVNIVRDDVTGGETKELQIHLTPRRNWGGRGLLGCHLLPI